MVVKLEKFFVLGQLLLLNLVLHVLDVGDPLLDSKRGCLRSILGGETLPRQKQRLLVQLACVLFFIELMLELLEAFSILVQVEFKLFDMLLVLDQFFRIRLVLLAIFTLFGPGH